MTVSSYASLNDVPEGMTIHVTKSVEFEEDVIFVNTIIYIT